MHPLQEKFQILTPAKEEAGEGWVTFESARDRTVRPQPESNTMPPGMDIGNQPSSQQDNMAFVLAGSTDVSGGMSSQDIARGFSTKKMNGCDDQYTGEHVDLFYGDSGGFVERNNYLDRI